MTKAVSATRTVNTVDILSVEIFALKWHFSSTFDWFGKKPKMADLITYEQAWITMHHIYIHKQTKD